MSTITIGALPQLTLINDVTRLPVETVGTTQSVTALTLAGYVGTRLSSVTPAITFNNSVSVPGTATIGTAAVGVSTTNTATITNSVTTTGLVTNFSTANAQITGGSITGTTGAFTTLTATNLSAGNVSFTGTASGTATTANVSLHSRFNNTSTNASFSPVFTDRSTTGNASAFVGAGITFNPSTNNLATTTFTGTFSGTASITSGSITGITGQASTLTATNFSTGNAQITGGSITGGTGQFSTLTATNLSSGNLQVSGAITPNANAVVDLGSTTAWFNNIYGVSTQARYADLAEIYTADKEYEPGTVVVFGTDTEVTISTVLADNRVAGVVSTHPAYLMNSEATGIAVALTGRVPCHVVGKIKRGDMLVTSAIPGVATSTSNPQIGTVIGKALENYDNNEVGVIEVVVGRL